jgi:hypothetical protein
MRPDSTWESIKQATTVERDATLRTIGHPRQALSEAVARDALLVLVLHNLVRVSLVSIPNVKYRVGDKRYDTHTHTLQEYNANVWLLIDMILGGL